MARNPVKWLEALAHELREKTRAARPDVAKRVFWSVEPPCQLEMFDFADPSNTLRSQVTFITHFDDLPDLQIDYHGPLTIWEALKGAETLLATGKWDRPLRPLATNASFGVAQYHDVVEGHVLQAVDSLRNAAQRWINTGRVPAPALTGGSNLGGDDRAMTSQGDFVSLDPATEATRIVEAAEARVERRNRRKARALAKKETLSGFHGFFYPPLWVGTAPQPSLAQKINPPMYREHVPATESQIAGRLFVVYDDGTFFVAEDRQEQATKLANGIMGFLLQCGLRCESLTEAELGVAEIELMSRNIGSTTASLGSLRNVLALAPDQNGLRRILPFRQRVESEALLSALTSADRHLSDAQALELLARSSEAWTHFARSEFTQCFILAWTLIERQLGEMWHEHLRGKSITGKRRSKLENSLTWTADHKVETLHMSGALGDDDYAELDRLRQQRNAIVHKLEGASSDESERCLDRALAYVRSKLGEVPKIRPEAALIR